MFVFDGDNTSTGYGGNGYTMNAGERLIGEHEGLTVDPDGAGGPLAAQTLHPANPGAHPTLTATGADVIDLDDANEVRGLTIDPSGAGGGIAGGTGDVSGTIDDVNITDTGTAGTQPGLELDATTGSFAVSNLDGQHHRRHRRAAQQRRHRDLRAHRQHLDHHQRRRRPARTGRAAGTGLGTSTFDAITVTGSGTGGVSLTNTTGTTTFGDLALTTTSGATAAFALSNAGTVSVPAAGTDERQRDRRPGRRRHRHRRRHLAFDAVSSTNSTTDGINLAGLGTGTFTAASGTITGAAGIAFDLDGGSGDVTYPGTIAQQRHRPRPPRSPAARGGTVTLSGASPTPTTPAAASTCLGNTGGTTTLQQRHQDLQHAAPARR